jgi:DNA-binding transcriptional regulator YiaG/uncharacterized phage-associated protein
MKSPFTDREMSIHKEWRTMKYRKEEFKVLFHFYKCEDTGELFEDDELANLNYNQLINQYREKYAIPFPDQIIAIRAKYSVSASRMSEILGLGTNVYRQYESGEVPNQSNARLIQLIDDPHEFRKLLNLSNTIDCKSKEKISHNIDAVLENLRCNKLENHLQNYFFESSSPNSFTGYVNPNLSKLAEMVVFFAEKMQPYKTKLNKLLFYADFSMFKRTGFSISGTQYKAISMGPVPLHFNSIFDYLVRNCDVDISYTTFPEGGIGEQFRPFLKRKFNSEIFTEKEKEIIESIAFRFNNTSTDEIIEISHREKAWIVNYPEQKIIDYKYSFELN